MSEHGSSSRRQDPPKKDKGKTPALSKPSVGKTPATGKLTPFLSKPPAPAGTITPFGPLVPHPSYPGLSVPVPSSSKLQVLGHIPKPYSSVLASQPREIDPFCASSNPTNPTNQIPSSSKKSDYVLNFQHILFHIEPHMKPKNNPNQLAADYFPPSWHFSPYAPHKGLSYYKDILLQTDSIHIKPIYDKNDPNKIIFHSLYIKRILSHSDWGGHQSALYPLTNSSNPLITAEESYFSYFDYQDAWSRIFLHQNSSFSHSWFIQFDHKFKSQIPFWFTNWWTKHGPRTQVLPSLLMDQVTYFSYKAKPSQHSLLPLLLHFISKYKVPWILRWQYGLFSPTTHSSSSPSIPSITSPPVKIQSQSLIPAVSRDFYLKWWDKFDIQRIISQVQTEFPPAPPLAPTKTSKNYKSSSASLHLSDIKEYSASELKTLLAAVNERQNELSHASDSEENSSADSSQPSVNQDPYHSQFQDSQDPYA